VGLYASSLAEVKLFHSVFTDNGYGVQAQPQGIIWLAQSMVTAATGVGYDAQVGGHMYTFGDNYILGINNGTLDQFYTRQ
jgi:hypothetical protein